MRFFTLEYYNTQHDYDRPDDGGGRAVWDGYSRHLEQMRGVLPDDVLALAELCGVDDGLIVRVEHTRRRRILVITMRCGDLQIGYYNLVLTYGGASLTPHHDRMLAYIARTGYDLAYHEVDRADNGRIEHRLLFHPGLWFAVQCDSLHWRKIPKPDRKLPRSVDRYPGGPSMPTLRRRQQRCGARRGCPVWWRPRSERPSGRR